MNTHDSPTQPKRATITIGDAITKYLNYIQASRSPGASRTYATGLRHFARFLADRDMTPEATDVQMLRVATATDFITWLYEYLLGQAGGQPEKISESTRATYIAALSGFFEYVIVEAQLLSMSTEDYDVIRKAMARAAKRHPRNELPPEKLPTQDIVQALMVEAGKPLNLPDTTPERTRHCLELMRLRDMAIIQALLSSGMRVGELVRLERGHLLHQVRGAVVKYTKSKKEREVLFSESAWEAIQTYLKARADGAQKRPLASLSVFARHDHRAGANVLPMTTRSVQNIFFNLASRAGILERFHLTPHTLRHFFATEFLSETGDLALTQYALGHSSPTTTRIYAQTKREDYRRAHHAIFGRGKKTASDS
jgi:site-specific recombinase XerD